ncbi:MAG: arylesterase [Rhodobacteraceae bacterium]|nr:arylesterase [Paracoccaceae bacterium]
MRKIGWRVAPLVGVVMMGLSAPLAARAEVVIAALGDSLTQGYGLAQDSGFVPQLQGWLTGQGSEVRLVNAGVSGDTTAGGAARVGWTLTDDVDGMIVALGANDLLRGIDPAVARANLDTILQAAQAAGVAVLLVGFEAPLNYGADYKASFDAIYPELSAQYGTLYADSFFAGLLGEGGSATDLAPYLQADRLHPNAEGVARIVEGLGPKVLDLARQAGG